MSTPYFPNQPAEMLDFESRLRHAAQMLPVPIRLAMYGLLSNTLSTLRPTEFVLRDGMTLASQNGGEIAFPDPLPLIKLSHIVYGYEEWLEHKYALPGFVEVEPGDVVVDCGAYVGGFSLSAAKKASQLHAFEPDAANFRCLSRNLAASTTARCNQTGLFDRTGRMGLNISASSVEHSLLMPDDGPPVAVHEIDVITLADYCRGHGIAALDFVKIEAEGVELEVFAGLGGMRPRKFAIDVSPERNGVSPADEFRRRLEGQGYEVRQRGHVMFARRGG